MWLNSHNNPLFHIGETYIKVKGKTGNTKVTTMTEDHTQDAIHHLQKAKESLALAGQPDKSAIASNIKRDLEIEEEI